MKKYTTEDIKSSKNTIVKFFSLQGEAKIEMLNMAYEFYKTFSKNKKSKKQFTKQFIKQIAFFNKAKKV